MTKGGYFHIALFVGTKINIYRYIYIYIFTFYISIKHVSQLQVSTKNIDLDRHGMLLQRNKFKRSETYDFNDLSKAQSSVQAFLKQTVVWRPNHSILCLL